MNHILEHSSYSQEEEIKNIILKYRKSGYISKSMSSTLDRISGTVGIYTHIISRISKLSKFFDIFETDLVDDKLFEFFEENYNYIVNFGITVDKPYYWRSSHSDGELSLIPSDQYMNSDNKEEYLFIFILNFVLNMNKVAESVAKNRREEYERDKGKNKFYSGSYNFNPENFFKAISHIQPSIVIKILHKNRTEYYENDWGYHHKILDMKGYSHKDFYNYTNSQSVSNDIKRRLSYLDSNIKPTDVKLVGNASYTSNYYYEDDIIDGEYIRHNNPNPILLIGDLLIKFNLNDSDNLSRRDKFEIGR